MTRLRTGNLASEAGQQRLDAWKAQGFNPDQCPIRRILDHVAAKWTVLILLELLGGARRFNQILRQLPDISRRMLTQSLRDLERDGMVTRTVFETRPPSVEYTLTDLGHSMLPPLLGLIDWAEQNKAAIFEAQDRFDLR
jgi:DNA-binding HxlR family transcriptional regulator